MFSPGLGSLIIHGLDPCDFHPTEGSTEGPKTSQCPSACKRSKLPLRDADRLHWRADPFANDENFLLSLLSLEELGATGNKVGLRCKRHAQQAFALMHALRCRPHACLCSAGHAVFKHACIMLGLSCRTYLASAV